MCMLDEIKARRKEIYVLARKHKAEMLWVFGSCARGELRRIGGRTGILCEMRQSR